ncbi:MAG: acetyl-CoA carboxylase biotin carboxylase subunit [Anaerolineae bacterium]
MIQSILIANRGEIACRIIRTCRRLGIRTAAVYADADAGARHTAQADEAIRIGPPPVSDSYLNIEAIIAAAKRAGVDGVHPGYGFLAENAAFARACAEAGLIFIGPSPEVIETMGDKRAARALMAETGVPVVPGYDGNDQSDEALQAAAAQIGYPVMVKAAGGGGGKGMRLVTKPGGLINALASARREALQSFGSDALILEKALARPRHIEFQVLGDQHGRVLHLGERECSIQRRHQKVIEETPSPALTPQLRAEMGKAAAAAARAIRYQNAGTVEFLLDEGGDFYFLEMNTRLQVEHPVTELVTGLDLVELQIRMAEGEPLPWEQEAIPWHGHAIEARLYAENPANAFLPVTGDVLLWRPPSGDGLRVDSGIRSGDAVTIHYDPLLAKIVAHGPDRKTTVRRLIRALETTVLLGLTHNLPFLQALLSHPTFQAGQLSTQFIPEQFAGWRTPAGDVTLALVAAALIRHESQPQPETNGGYWRNNPSGPPPYRFMPAKQEEPVDVFVEPGQAHSYHVRLSPAPDAVRTVTLEPMGESDWAVTVDGYRQRVTAVARDDKWWIQTRPGVVHLLALHLLPEPKIPASASGSLRAPMPGSVLDVLVEVGEHVRKGQALMTLEAMKMEHTIRTAVDGIVAAIFYAPGDTVEADAQLIQIESP